MLVEFYAPWCGHCKHLQPEFAKAATRLLKEDPPIKLGKVDATIESALGQEYGVQGYPTLKVFRNGVASDYNGPREEAGIVKYMKGQSGPGAKSLGDATVFDTFVKFAEDVSIVGFFESDAAAASFKKAADVLREELRFGLVTDKKLIASLNGGKSGIVTFVPFAGEEPKIVFSGDVNDQAAIESFAYSSSLPLAGSLTSDTASRYEKTGLPRLTVYSKVDAKKNAAGLRYYLNRLRKVAKNFVGKLLFVASDSEGHGAKEFGEFGFSAAAKAGLAVIDAAGGKFKSAITEITPESIQAFAESFLSGKASKHVKSEDLPADNSSPVKVLVGKNFDELVTNSDKDVFIEFYAPWCGHCKSLTPKWEKLGEDLKHVDTLTIAKIDATANDVPKLFDVKGFPTIHLLKANDKKNPVAYSGAREVADFKKWLGSNVHHKFSATKSEL